MEKIYLIQQTTVFEDEEFQGWNTVWAVKNLAEAKENIKKLRESERENRLERIEKYEDVLYKVYYKLKVTDLY